MIFVERMNGAEEIDGGVRSFDHPDGWLCGGMESADGEGAEEDEDGSKSSEEVHRTTFRDENRIAEMVGGGNTPRYRRASLPHLRSEIWGTQRQA